jgi:hypothetical protein
MDRNQRCERRAGRDGNPREQTGMTAMDGLYGRYHGRLPCLARAFMSTGDRAAHIMEAAFTGATTQ